ncbi:MAG: RluA family pseudouridine synthase [Clostridia bacterium]|nr:RluA family pseudouridine synthase [Clostridia bacterium]
MEVLFKDENIIVCVKPVGVDSEHEMPQLLISEHGGEIFTLHRLDKNVGGVMVFARNKQTAALFSRLIQEGCLIKEYLAVVHGVPEEQAVLEDLLWKDSKKNKVFVVKSERKGVKRASLEYERIAVRDDKSLVHITLHTGRSHQIRVQFSSRKFPLVGDHKYGSRDERVNPLLFSSKITFPYKGERLSFSSEPEFAKEMQN